MTDVTMTTLPTLSAGSTNQATQRRAQKGPRPMDSFALPVRLTTAVEDFKSEMLSVDKQLVAGAISETEAQRCVSQACTAVVDDFGITY